MLKNLQIDRDFTDAELVFCSDIYGTTESINVHKCILASHSQYFYKLFSKDKNNNVFEIRVRDDKISKDIILSEFYYHKPNYMMYPEWKFQLETYLCKDYFMIDNDITLLYNLRIPSDEYGLLLEVIILLNLNDNILFRTAYVNLPDKYNINKLDKDLVNAIMDNNESHAYHIFYQEKDNIIKKWNVKTGEFIKFIITKNEIENAKISTNGKIRYIQIFTKK